MKRRINVLSKILFFLFFSLESFSQGVSNLWLMGYDGGWGGFNFEFSSGSLVIDTFTRKMNFGATDASICDKNGNILFYTNGLWVANSLHDTMVNGSGLNPGPYSAFYAPYGLPFSQGALILPFPGDSLKYYIFHGTVTIPSVQYPTLLKYSIVDLALHSGKGEVILKNTILLSDTLAWFEITASKHANGRDWWLIQHKAISDLYYIYLITPSGINGPYTQNIGIIRYSGIQSSFSPDGSKFARYDTYDELEIYDFDRCTGFLSNPIHIIINDSMVGGGLAFSPSGRYVYASSVKYVYQFDLLSPNIAASMQTVAVWDGYYSPVNSAFAATFYLMQLAPDGKIYINCGNSTVDMHVINYPDSAGLACDLQQHSIHLPAFNAFSVPNHPNYFLGALAGSPCDSLTSVSSYNSTVIHLTIAPNPAKNVFNINYKLPYGTSAVVSIYDMMGKLLERRGIYSSNDYLQVNCSHWENGVYVVRVEATGYSGSGKLVIAR